MAQIENGGGNGKGKCHQKKMTIRVDFTPMVDMNMLLITFFMLCTTMIKTQTMNIVLPSNRENLNTEQKNQASKDDAVTIILDAKRNAAGEVDSVNGTVIPEVYYYVGMPKDLDGVSIVDDSDLENVLVTMPAGKEKIVKASFDKGPEGIRAFIEKRNKETLDKMADLREKFKNKEIEKAAFDSISTVIRNDETIEHKPVIIIKATGAAPYGSLVSLLDEMQINQIAKYQIDNITPVDEALLKDFRARNK